MIVENKKKHLPIRVNLSLILSKKKEKKIKRKKVFDSIKLYIIVCRFKTKNFIILNFFHEFQEFQT